ncbi:hypothetical protein KIN20_031435 [Parelaphostrongylus tenuis]|uniref:DH domain-containing protein n=1 Tax=Parelaphostrongylus tenuis TaxID=148309 RepID=A0AAD5R6P4_PARTN|nr:hypothetical protein KIN20_031435 [Parelaphostrongylus tenuis]
MAEAILGDDETRKTFMICQEMHSTEMHYIEKLRLLILVGNFVYKVDSRPKTDRFTSLELTQMRDALLARFAEKRPLLEKHDIVTAFGKVQPSLTFTNAFAKD